MCSKNSDMLKPLKKAKGIMACGMRPTKHVLRATVRSMVFCLTAMKTHPFMGFKQIKVELL